MRPITNSSMFGMSVGLSACTRFSFSMSIRVDFPALSRLRVGRNTPIGVSVTTDQRMVSCDGHDVARHACMVVPGGE